MILKGYIFGVLYALVCLLVALVAYKLGMPKKYSRKLVHILVGAEWIILSHYFGASYHFLIVCVLFLVLLTVAHFGKLMPMISSESDNAPGTVYYAVAMTVMAVICLFNPDMLTPFGIGVFCTSLGDGFAGVVGQLVKKCNPKIYGTKTLFGASANFVISSATAIVFTYVFDMGLEIWQCLMIGLLALGLELITVFGLDNITITLGTSFLAYAFIFHPIIDIYIVPIVLTPLVIAVVIQKKVLTRLGILFAVILDAVISLTLGNFGFVLLLVFLFGSVLIDKFKKHRAGNDSVTKKGDCRDAVQVMANGLIPMVMALFYSVTLDKAFVIGYIAALAEALADTAASGVGVYSKNTFDIFRRQPVAKGLSGGMSVIGTAASLVGAFVIGLIAFAWSAVDWVFLLIVAASAFLGAVFDSLLGSLVQVKYKCPVCGVITEKDVHCNKLTKKHSGFEFFDNDVVNLLSGAFSAILAAILYAVII